MYVYNFNGNEDIIHEFEIHLTLCTLRWGYFVTGGGYFVTPDLVFIFRISRIFWCRKAKKHCQFLIRSTTSPNDHLSKL